MEINTTKNNYDISLAQEFQNHLSNKLLKYGIVDYGKHKTGQVKKSG